MAGMGWNQGSSVPLGRPLWVPCFGKTEVLFYSRWENYDLWGRSTHGL